MATSTLAGQPTEVTHRAGPFVQRTHEDRWRRMVGAALVCIASCKQFAAALQLHHSQASRRRSGSGPLPTAGVEIGKMELAGISTDRVRLTFDKIALHARALARPVYRCLKSAIHRVSLVSCAEDRARADYHAGLITAEQYAEALLAEARENESAALALLAEGGAR